MTIPAHTHGPGGEILELAAPAAAADVESVEAAGDAAVEVARVEAERDVALGQQQLEQTKMYTEAELVGLQVQVEELQRENRTLREQLTPPEPEIPAEPAAAPIVVNDAEPEMAPPPAGEIKGSDIPPAKKKSGGLFPGL